MHGLVSVSEKTLEHWSSQYVAYRYKSHAALWWPSVGEDINIRWLPTKPGKAIQLELKTTTVAGIDLHDVMIDLGQLWEYRKRPLAHQPFYAFPWPDWQGQLATAANEKGVQITDLAFSRSGPDWWFAQWMVVVTAAQVADVLKNELAAHGCGKRKSKKRLVRFDLSRAPAERPIWGSGTPAPEVNRWLDFWTELERCGKAGWPQLIWLPASLIQAKQLRGRSYTRSQVNRLLRQARSQTTLDDQDHDEYLALTPEEDGNYRIAAESTGDVPEPEPADVGEVNDHRQVVFLDTKALFPPK